jgi:hypothetical protein
MKKRNLVLLTALAAAFASSSAFATVNFADGTGAAAFAKELTYSDATPLVGNGSGDTSMSGALGFGVSDGATRYIRISYGNAVLDGTAGILSVTDAGAAPTTVNGVIVQGGGAGDNFVIYQFTATTTDFTAASTIAIADAAGYRVTSTAAPVTASYKLHETAVDAVNGTNALSSKDATLATFSTALKYAVTTGTAQAIVADAFKKFTGSAFTASLGTVDYGVNAVKKHDGAAVTLTQLVAATTAIEVTGDFGAAGSVFLATTAGDGACTLSVGGSINPAKTVASIVVDTTPYNKDICYTVTGTVAVPAQTVNQALNLTAAAGSGVVDTTSGVLGTITHDGAETWALNITSPDNGDATFVRVSNTSATAHGLVTATLVGQDGATLGSGTLVADLLAGATSVLSSSDIATAMGVATWTGRAKLHIVAEIPATALRVQNLIRSNGVLTNLGGDTSTNNN